MNTTQDRWTALARAGLFTTVLAVGFLFFRHVSPGPKEVQRDVWAALQPRAARWNLDARFVYALVAAESGFDPHARHGDARGLLQLTPAAWASVSRVPYPGAVWDWRTNLGVGIDRLGKIRQDLEARGAFSYPLLLAAYQHGFEYVAARQFDVRRMPRPEGPIARRLWSGELHPVEPPR